jgi:iron complex outermembrane recepter protein
MQNPMKGAPPPSNPLLTIAVRNAIRTAMLTGAVGATCGTGVAQAQDATPAATTNLELQEVVVTGSRIRQPALEAVSPVTTVSAAEIQESGTTRIEDLLNQLPQVTGDMGSSLSNGATGAATVSLRGLGCQRTLVMINSRRLMPGDPTINGNACADLNDIPAALVDRVDVLTGGASAVYGADAVAGVVNFVMNDHFEGFRLDGNYSAFNHSQHDGGAQADELAAGFPAPTSGVTDGNSRDLTALMGSNFADGKGNAVAYLGYRYTDPVLEGSRDFSACSLTTSSGPKTRGCGGSATSNPAFFLLNGGYYTLGAGNQVVPAKFAGAGTSLYNYAPLNYFQRPDERYTAGFLAHYDVNDHARVYMEFQFMDDRTDAQIAPSGAFFLNGTGTTAGFPNNSWAVNCNNPYLNASEYSAFGCTSPTDTAQVIFGRRDVEGAARSDDLGHTSFRAVLGVKGDLNDVWSYDTYFQNGVTRFSEEYFNQLSQARITNALQAVTQTKNGVTSVVCAANANGANGAPGCVPWDIFQAGGVTPAAVAYLEVPAESKGFTQETIWESSITGDLGKMGVKLPSANTGLGLNVGADWRQEKSEFEPDLEYITNDLAGGGGPSLPTTGGFSVWEIYGEARLPIIDDMPMAKSLSAEVGYRYSDYTLSFGATNTWKAGLEWAPVQDVRFRGMFNVAVRAPNIQELYLPSSVQLDGTIDPCSGTAPSASFAECARSGVTAAEYGHIPTNPAAQYNGLEAGNSSLKPERADTTTVGLVFTPTFLPALTGSLDYYNIKIKNVIGTYGANLILTTCLDTGDPLYCDKVHRAVAPGTAGDGALFGGPAGYITDTDYNLGEQQAEGFDLNTDYRLDMGFLGKLDLNLVTNYNLHFRTQPVPGGGTYDCAGYYGPACGEDGGPAPHIKSVFRISYNTPLPGLDAWIKWRFVGPVKTQNLSQNPLLAGTVLTAQGMGTQIPGYNYLDLGVQYQVNKTISVRFGVNNLLDKDPPNVPEAYEGPPLVNGNTFPQVYDWGGRFLFANITLDF